MYIQDTSASVRPAQAIAVGRSRLDSCRHRAVDSELRRASLAPRRRERAIQVCQPFRANFGRCTSRKSVAKARLCLLGAVLTVACVRFST